MCAVLEALWRTTARKTLLFAVVFALAGCSERFSREDFEALVKDKSASEVTARLGKPNAVDEIGGTVRWIYTSRTFSVGSGSKMDWRAILLFRPTDSMAPARVVEVQYE